MTDLSTIAEIDVLEELLSATARGDRQAFQRVYQLSGGRLFAVALRILRRREPAEDVLQEAFLAIWRKAHQYRPERGAALAWMIGIVRHRAIDRLRAERLEPRQDLAAEEQLDGLGQPIADHEGSRAMRDCLGRLQDGQQKAIVLAYYYGLTHEELAGRLDAPLGTVKSWVRRGLLQLKGCLDQ